MSGFSRLLSLIFVCTNALNLVQTSSRLHCPLESFLELEDEAEPAFRLLAQ